MGRQVVGGMVIGLVGPLGAGKTLLVRGVASGMGLPPERVTSPTFVLMNIYAPESSGRRLIHIDLYRIEDLEEIFRLGLLDEAGPEDATIIEWADKAVRVLPADTIWITISETLPLGGRTEETSRTITIEDPSGCFQETK